MRMIINKIARAIHMIFTHWLAASVVASPFFWCIIRVVVCIIPIIISPVQSFAVPAFKESALVCLILLVNVSDLEAEFFNILHAGKF